MSKLAVNGGPKVRTKPFHPWPVVTDEIVEDVTEVARSGKWGHNSEVTERHEGFHREFAEYHGVEYALTTTNGSTALELALRNLGVTFGDEVITPGSTWCATNLAAVIVGADPVFVDGHPSNYCIDPDLIEEAITPKTKAILITHIGGYVCEMDRIMEIANRHGLPVIEDCAQAHGASYKGKKVGTFGAFGCFSFQIGKLMSAGEGGMIISSDRYFADPPFGPHRPGEMAAKIRSTRKHGMGWNYRLGEFQIAVLRPQLRTLEDLRRNLVKNAEYLKDRLNEIDGVAPMAQTLEQTYYSYLFRYDSKQFKDVPKKKFQDALRAEAEGPWWWAVASVSDQGPAYCSEYFHSPRRDYSDVYCPVAERAFKEEAIGIKGTVLMGDTNDMDDIINMILKIRENIDELV